MVKFGLWPITEAEADSPFRTFISMTYIIFQKLYPLGAGSLEIRIAMKHEIKVKFANGFFRGKISPLMPSFFKLRNKEKEVSFGKFSMAD